MSQIQESFLRVKDGPLQDVHFLDDGQYGKFTNSEKKIVMNAWIEAFALVRQAWQAIVLISPNDTRFKTFLNSNQEQDAVDKAQEVISLAMLRFYDTQLMISKGDDSRKDSSQTCNNAQRAIAHTTWTAINPGMVTLCPTFWALHDNLDVWGRGVILLHELFHWSNGHDVLHANMVFDNAKLPYSDINTGATNCQNLAVYAWSSPKILNIKGLNGGDCRDARPFFCEGKKSDFIFSMNDVFDSGAITGIRFNPKENFMGLLPVNVIVII